MLRPYLLPFSLLLLLSIGPQVSVASTSEREVLARVVHELDLLERWIKEADATQPKDQRIRFHYAWLRQDLERIKAGIREHLASPQTEPRAFPPLRGDYRR